MLLLLFLPTTGGATPAPTIRLYAAEGKSGIDPVRTVESVRDIDPRRTVESSR